LAVPAGDLEGLVPLDLWGSTGDRIMIEHADMQIVLLRQGACSLQLNVHGAGEGKVHLFAEAVSRNAMEDRRQILDALSDLQRIGRLRPERFRPYPRGSRLRQVLCALDGYLAGASHRRIAIALFGEARVTAEWSDPRGHLRDTVRRAVLRGRWLMSGGYRGLVG
jgi:hypothetical protein